jgi:predicted ATPase
LRSEEIKFQVALINALMHVKGYSAPQTKDAVERARLLIEQAETLGEPVEDPLMLLSVLQGSFSANMLAFNGDIVREIANQFLALAEKQGTVAPLLMAHRVMGIFLLYVGDFVKARMHFEEAIALYDPAQHLPLATRFGQDARVHAFSYRSWALWFLGYPDAAVADAERALREGRNIAQAATLMNTLTLSSITHILCRNYEIAGAQAGEVAALADEKGSLFWKPFGMMQKGCVFAATKKPSEAVHVITEGLAACRSTGTTLRVQMSLCYLAKAYAELGEFDHARRFVDEAMTAIQTTKEQWFEPEANRVAGEIAALDKKPDLARAQACFERALFAARQQQAKSWELRAAMSLARLWRDQGKVQEGRELLAPVYGWFTEGFDTRDLKEAKALLEELAA